MRIVTIFALLTMFPSYVHAYILCTEPKEPYCVSNEFQDEADFFSCKSEMDRYKRNVNSYVACLSEAGDEEIRKYNKAVERFNCRARRESYCF